MQIQLYNETMDSRCIRLHSSPVDAETMVGVAFTHPAGIFRLNKYVECTHMTAVFEGKSYVYKITSFKAINNGVCEYSYTLDFLKDYFNRHTLDQFKGTKAFVTRCTLESQWNKWVDDNNIFIDGDIQYRQGAAQVTQFGAGCYLLVLKSSYADPGYRPVRLYVLSHNEYYTLMQELLSTAGYYTEDEEPSEEAQKRLMAINQIAAVYYCPLDIRGTGGGTIEWSGSTSTRGDFDIANVTGKALAPLTSSNGLFHESIANLWNYIPTDFRDIYETTYTISIPFLGSYTIQPIRFLKGTDSKSIEVGFNVDINPIDGTISMSWIYPNNDSRIPHYNFIDTKPLPQLTLPNPSLGSAAFSNATSYANSITALNKNAVMSIANNAMSSSSLSDFAGKAVATGVNYLANRVEANITHNRNMNMIEATNPVYSGGCVGFAGLMFPYTTIEIFKTKCSFYPEVYGYIVNKPISDVFLAPTHKYWFDVSTAKIEGPSWYADGVRSDIGRDYVYIE